LQVIGVDKLFFIDNFNSNIWLILNIFAKVDRGKGALP
jgi:hypothetical protein